MPSFMKKAVRLPRRTATQPDFHVSSFGIVRPDAALPRNFDATGWGITLLYAYGGRLAQPNLTSKKNRSVQLARLLVTAACRTSWNKVSFSTSSHIGDAHIPV